MHGLAQKNVQPSTVKEQEGHTLADQYLHGSYGFLGDSRADVASKVSTLPVYFGTAPVHLLPDYSGTINEPLLIHNRTEAVRKVGYSSDWSSFSLCEVIEAHFSNSIEPIGPVCFVNVFDPDTMRGTTEQTVSVTLIGGRGTIPNDKIIFSSVTIDGKTLDTDYLLDYDTGTDALIVQSIGTGLTSPVDVKFYEADPSQVAAADVIGGQSVMGKYTGVSAVNLVYQRHNMVPTLLAAPGWDHIQAVAEEIAARSQKINGHWYAFGMTSLTGDKDDATLQTIDAWKTANGYNEESAKCMWPFATKNGKIYHLSTIAVVRTMQTDAQNRGIPFETPSNKPIDIESLCHTDGTLIEFDKSQANELNAKGITTGIFWGGGWVLWGGHTQKYSYNSTNDVRCIFDPYMRMLYYVVNTFQLRYGDDVDKPMDRRLKDRILSDVQEWLDGLETVGALLYGKIRFEEEDNVTSDLIQGDFLFDIEVTATPPAKSITARVSYTDSGLSIYFGEVA